MATINENYVSFETAKLLKKKGFDWNCITYYVDDEPDGVKYSMLFENNRTWEDKCCSASTLQMAMKWLREMHNINIDIVSIWNHKRFEYQVFVITPENAKHCYIDDELYLGYEQACDSAIKYCLENLI